MSVHRLLILFSSVIFIIASPHMKVFAQAIGSPTPSPTPFAVPKTAPPEITVGTFYNAKKQTNPTFLLWGTGDALSTITINIFPDNISGATSVDNVGRWQWATPKSLTNGPKQLTITITNDKGGQTVKTDTFTVMGAFQFPVAPVLFLLALGSVVGIYIWIQLKKPTPPSPTQPPSTPLPPQATIVDHTNKQKPV